MRTNASIVRAARLEEADRAARVVCALRAAGAPVTAIQASRAINACLETAEERALAAAGRRS